MKLFPQRLWGCAFALILASNPGLGQSGSTAEQVNSASRGFGFRLVKELARQAPNTDVFVSPFSIGTVLQMLSNGAHGRTEEELRRSLGTTNLTPASVNAAYHELNRALSSQTNSILNVANALWYRADATLNPQFASANQMFFGAELSPLDFSSPSSADQINAWVDQATHGKIPRIVSAPLAPNTAMILASAIYFKGTWLHPFDPKLTRERAFHLTNGGQVSVPMMMDTRSWLYAQGDGYQALQMPYAGGDLAMQVLLPGTNSSLPNLLNRLNATFWAGEVLAGLRTHRGSVVLPKFTLRYATDLKTSLSALGLSTAFGPQADFSGISSGSLFVSELQHQAFVDVNEQGTEAAAVTTGVVALTSVQNQPPPFQMILDRPFLFAISDLRTRSLLFLGLVYNPASGAR